MSLLENKNNSGIKQLNQISEFSENQLNNDNNNQEIDSNQKESEEEEEEEEEREEGEEDVEDNNNSNNNNNNNMQETENIEEGNEENESSDIDEENLSLVSLYKYKLNYDERINIYPRLNTKFLIYKNSKSENNFISNSDNPEIKPSVRAYFTNIEETNSSIKLIRPSQYIIPNNLNQFSNTLNLFGINVEPFSLDEKQNSLEFIQKIDVKINNKNNNQILQCSNCKAYFHKLNFNLECISDNNFFQNYKYFCLICKKYEEIFTINSSVENQDEKDIKKYKIFTVPNIDINKPSIEYIIKEKNENNFIRNIIQIIILDLSNKDFLAFIYRSLNEIIGNLNEKELDKNEINIKYVLIAYQFNKIYFIYLNKLNRIISVSIMRDLKDPFCPIEPTKLFCSSKEFLELFGNFYNSFCLNIIEQNQSKASLNYFDINNSIIKSIFSLIKINKINENNNNKYYYHLIFFSSFNYNVNIDLFKENKIYNIFLSFFLLSKKPNNANIPFIDNINIHNIKFYYFPIEYEDSDDIIIKHQEIKNILNKIINIRNYIFDIKLNICYDKKIFKNILNNDSIYINFFPNKSSLNKIYILPQIGKPSLLSAIHIQYNIEFYIFNSKNKHIRILTFMNKISNDSIEIYKSFDEEVLFRIVLAYHIKDLNLSKNNFNSINKLYADITNKNDKIFSKLINNIVTKIKKTFAKNYKNGTEKRGIYIPLSLKLFPLYFFCFIKQITNGLNLNLLNLIYDCKIKTLMKCVYPSLISFGYKSKSKREIFYLHPLSIGFFDKMQLLLLDEGLSITLLINPEIKNRIKEHYLLKKEEEEGKIDFKAESMIINDMIKNRPIKIICLNDNIILSKKFLSIFFEDKIIENINDEIENEPKFELDNEYIQNDISYSDFYGIISQTVYEFFE